MVVATRGVKSERETGNYVRWGRERKKERLQLRNTNVAHMYILTVPLS